MRSLLRALFLLGVLSACAPTPVAQSGTATHTERGVTVDIEVVVDNDGSALATARFTPDTQDWHLYDTSMALDGVEGFGRPTRLDITSGALSMGPTTADREPYDLAIGPLGITVPVYPDGPVTLTTPFVSTDSSVDVALTYMSCGSDGGCTVPVTNRTVQITLTQAD